MSQPVMTDALEQAASNQRNLRRLVVSVQASLHKLNLLIAVCDNPRYRDELIRTYEAELTANGIVCDQVRLDRQQPSLKQSLIDWQAHLDDRQSETPIVVTVRGGDELLGVRLQEPKSAQERFFFSVQWTREGLRDFQFPIVLWVTQAISQGLAQQAPDFWSWRGGVFEFVQPIGASFLSPKEDLEIAPSIGSTDGSELTDQFTPLADPDALAQQIADLQAEDLDSPLLESLYESLGEAYYQRLERGIAVDRPQEEANAIAAFKSAIAYRETLTDLTLLATSLSYLGLLYELQGRYAEAEPLLLQALDISQRQLGDDHPDVAQNLNNLALLYQSQGRYAEAEPLHIQALDIWQRQLGDDHPNVATSLNNLAGLYQSQGRYAEAEPLLLRSLEIKQKTLPQNHPSIQHCWNIFCYSMQKTVEAGKTNQLSDHPITQMILQHIKSDE